MFGEVYGITSAYPTSLKSLRLRFDYLFLTFLTYPYFFLPFLTIPYLSLYFLTFPYLSLPFLTVGNFQLFHVSLAD